MAEDTRPPVRSDGGRASIGQSRALVPIDAPQGRYRWITPPSTTTTCPSSPQSNILSMTTRRPPQKRLSSAVTTAYDRAPPNDSSKEDLCRARDQRCYAARPSWLRRRLSMELSRSRLAFCVLVRGDPAAVVAAEQEDALTTSNPATDVTHHHDDLPAPTARRSVPGLRACRKAITEIATRLVHDASGTGPTVRPRPASAATSRSPGVTRQVYRRSAACSHSRRPSPAPGTSCSPRSRARSAPSTSHEPSNCTLPTPSSTSR